MGGGVEEVGESDTEGDVAREWGGEMDNGGEEEVYQGDVVRRSTPSLCPSTIAPNNDDDPTTTSSTKPCANTHEGQLGHHIFHQGELVNVNVGKASYQALVVLIKNEKATVRWMTWKGLDEVHVNQLCPICDGSKRKRKQTDRFGHLVPTTKKLKTAATAARGESVKGCSWLEEEDVEESLVSLVTVPTIGLCISKAEDIRQPPRKDIRQCPPR